MDTSFVQMLQVVIEDLEYLSTTWDQSIDDASLRRASPILRRFIYEGDLDHAWQSVGFSENLSFEATNLDFFLEGHLLGEIKFATAGGALYQGMQVWGAFHIEGRSLSEEEIKADYNRTKNGPFTANFDTEKFKQSSCVVIEGQKVSRVSVIKYVANKLGGTHFDTSRKGRKDDQIFALLDKAYGNVQIAGKNYIYYELLSIGQSIVNSSKTQRLMKKIKELLAL